MVALQLFERGDKLFTMLIDVYIGVMVSLWENTHGKAGFAVRCVFVLISPCWKTIYTGTMLLWLLVGGKFIPLQVALLKSCKKIDDPDLWHSEKKTCFSDPF